MQVSDRWGREGIRWGVAFFLFTATLHLAGAATPLVDRRIVRPHPAVDTNGNRFHDLLEEHVANGTVRLLVAAQTQAGPASPLADLIICLNHAPTPSDVAAVHMAGGVVVWTMGHKPDSLIFAMQVGWPVTLGSAASLQQLRAAIPGVVWVDENFTPELTMLYSTKQTGTRRSWVADGLRGRSDRTVVIFDTGLDDSHPDLSGRIVGWKDTTTDNAATPRDPQHHGTHVAGTAVGTGGAAGIASGTGQLHLSDTTNFTGATNSFFPTTFPVDTTGYGSPAAFQANLFWVNTAGSGSVTLHLLQWTGGGYTSVASVTAAMGAAQPLTLNATIPTGQTRVDWAVGAIRSIGGDTSKYWVQVKAPVTAAGDGFNLNSGIAPNVQVAGVRLFDDAGAGSGDDLVGFSWINTNRSALGIIAVNNSWSFTNTIVPSTDTAVNNLVANGVVVEASAGNGRTGSTDKVGSPASASAAIATAALNALDQVTFYSSFGSTSLGQSKPDVSAPGGSTVNLPGQGEGRFIASIDSNDADEQDVGTDKFSNDYVYDGWQGTSMSGPHATGAAALVAQAIEQVYGAWSWDTPQSTAFANRVKMLLGMTATETNQNAESSGPHPTLDRGAKDISEGFGRINVDAAVETVLRALILGTPDSATLGNDPLDRKAWGRRVSLIGGVSTTFDLAVPAGADFDLYLYRDEWTDDGSTSSGSIGDPIIEQQSTTASAGADETITVTPSASATYFVVVKRVSGSDTFTLTSTPLPFLGCAPSAPAATGLPPIPVPRGVPVPQLSTVPQPTPASVPQPQCGG